MTTELAITSDDVVAVTVNGRDRTTGSDYRIEGFGGKADDPEHDNCEPLLAALEENRDVTFGRGVYYFASPIDAARLKSLYSFSITGIRPEVSHQHYENPAGFENAGTVLRFDNQNESDWCFDIDTKTAKGNRLGPVVFRDLVIQNNGAGSSIRIADESDTSRGGKNSVGVCLSNIILTKPNELYSSEVAYHKFPFLDPESPADDKRIAKTSPVTTGLRLTKAYDCVLQNVKVRGHRVGVDILGSDSIQASGIRTSFCAWGVRHYRESGPSVPGRWHGIYCEGSSACQSYLDTGSVFGIRCENSTAQADLGAWDTTGLTWTWKEGSEYIYVSGFGDGDGYDATDYFEPLLPATFTSSDGNHSYTVGISEINAADNSLKIINSSGYCYANRDLSGNSIRRYFGIPFIFGSGEVSLIAPELTLNRDYENLPLWAVYPSSGPALLSGARSTFNALDQADNKGIICGWTPGETSPPGPAILIEGGNRLHRPDHPLAVYHGLGYYDKSVSPYYESPASSIPGRRWAGTCSQGMRDTKNAEVRKLEMRQKNGRWGVTLAYVSWKGREWVLTGLKAKSSWVINWKVDMVAETGEGDQSMRISTHHETDNKYTDHRIDIHVTEDWQTFGGELTTTDFAAGQENYDFRLAVRSNSGEANIPVLVGDFLFTAEEIT